jgi:hypothetical protein
MSKALTIDYNNSRTKSVIGVDYVDNQQTDWTAHDNCEHIPNAVTLAAMREADEHIRQLEAGEIQSRFNNLAEFFVSLFSEEDEE